MVDIVDKHSALRRIDGDEELYNEIVALFLEEVPTQLASLTSAFKEGNVAAASLNAHSLKSAAANIGAEAMRDVAMRMEAVSREGDLEKTRELMPALEEAFRKVRTFFAA